MKLETVVEEAEKVEKEPNVLNESRKSSTASLREKTVSLDWTWKGGDNSSTENLEEEYAKALQSFSVCSDYSRLLMYWI